MKENLKVEIIRKFSVVTKEFKLVDGGISVISKDAIWNLETFPNDEILFPFFVQMALGGINRTSTVWEIKENKEYVSIYYNNSIKQSFKKGQCELKAKEQALKYIYDNLTP